MRPRSFFLPLLLWMLVSYVPGVWQPMVRIVEPGGVSFYRVDMLVDKAQFATQGELARAAGLPLPTG
ncbi:MAG TPA: nitrate ABC transporter permease, partial [Gammaproteobacteria bacterium]|nr:nitrate ABC transporter permease [Gammaproteobacteria bacterium]